MSREVAYEIHALTSRLDRAADRLLRERFGLSYRRFMVVHVVGRLDGATQRELARELDVSEPAISRMAGVLTADGLLRAEKGSGRGNRREVVLTDRGRRLLGEAQAHLSRRLAAVVRRSGIPTAEFLGHARRLSDALDEAAKHAGRDGS